MQLCYRAMTSALLTAALVSPAAAQEPLTWENSTEFSFVTTSGNASSTTLGLKSGLTGTGDVSVFKFQIGGIRASSDFRERSAVGTESSFTVTEATRTEKSAENYFARSRFDRNLGDNDFFVFGGAGWERNTFAGYNHRVSLVAGVGDTWVNDDRTLFKTDIGATYTIQKDVDPTPGASDGFGGLRATLELTRDLSETTAFESSLVVDENLQNTDDLRFDWVSSVSVALTEGLAFKTSWQLLFDNDPALVGIPLFDNGGAPADVNVLVPTQEFDSFLTVSLVIKL